MTDEQIKQNAEEYANSMYDKKYQCEPWKECYMIHNAGAHSRDEEIEMWKRVVEERQLEIEKLRNPWVSVEDRLPENGEMVFTRSIIKTEGGGKCVEDEQFLVQQFIGKWISDNRYQQTFRGITFNAINNVTHWMPIPQIKKG
jgi:hypothetical protein